MKVVVTGGAGYIGSHTCVELIQRGHEVEVIDNLENASPRSLDHVAKITGTSPRLHRLDIRDPDLGRRLDFSRFDALIHFAALKSVSESVREPLSYFDNNIAGTLNLLSAMQQAGLGRMVFSSSATVYGIPTHCPVREDAALSCTNPYGRSKLVMEGMLADVGVANPGFRSGVLRYFNPVGAHPTGLLGEAPSGTPNNLMPYVAQVASGLREELQVFGGDYPTPDGTGVRDYIHVVDLAEAHADALDYLASDGPGVTVNLGTGKGYSVLEVVSAFRKASGRDIPLRIVDRRPGDVAECYADPSLAKQVLGWTAKRDLQAMCEDAWRWQRMFPGGYPA